MDRRGTGRWQPTLVTPDPVLADGPPARLNPLPALLALRRASELVETVAFDLAGRESPLFVSRLIEIAAELDRHSRDTGRSAGEAGPVRRD